MYLDLPNSACTAGPRRPPTIDHGDQTQCSGEEQTNSPILQVAELKQAVTVLPVNSEYTVAQDRGEVLRSFCCGGGKAGFPCEVRLTRGRRGLAGLIIPDGIRSGLEPESDGALCATLLMPWLGPVCGRIACQVILLPLAQTLSVVVGELGHRTRKHTSCQSRHAKS